LPELLCDWLLLLLSVPLEEEEGQPLPERLLLPLGLGVALLLGDCVSMLALAGALGDTEAEPLEESRLSAEREALREVLTLGEPEVLLLELGVML